MNDRAGIIGRLDRTGWPLLAARLVLGVTFIYMGSVKAADPVEFLKQLHQFRMLPETPPVFLNATAIVLPWIEVVVGTALLIGLHVRGAALAAVIMLAVFTPAILIRALDIRAQTGVSFFEIKFDCGCGGGPVIIWTKLLSNFGLLLLAVYALLSRSDRFMPARWVERQLAGPNAATAR